MNPIQINASRYPTGVRAAKALCFAIAGLALAAGCDRDDGTKSVPPPPAVSATTVPTTRSAAPVTTQAGGGVPAGADEARQRAAAAEGTARAAGTQAAAGVQSAAAKAQTQAAAASQMTSDEATKMLDQAVTYIKENKYDLADKSLTQLEGMKASLSPSLQQGVTQARTMLNGAKASNNLGNLKLPGAK